MSVDGMYVSVMEENFCVLDSITRVSVIQNYRFTLNTANIAKNRDLSVRQPLRTSAYHTAQQTVFNTNQNIFYYRLCLD